MQLKDVRGAGATAVLLFAPQSLGPHQPSAPALARARTFRPEILDDPRHPIGAPAGLMGSAQAPQKDSSLARRSLRARWRVTLALLGVISRALAATWTDSPKRSTRRSSSACWGLRVSTTLPRQAQICASQSFGAGPTSSPKAVSVSPKVRSRRRCAPRLR